jgi:hypothetical protein
MSLVFSKHEDVHIISALWFHDCTSPTNSLVCHTGTLLSIPLFPVSVRLFSQGYLPMKRKYRNMDEVAHKDVVVVWS